MLVDQYKPAGVCYSCSVQCHGEHTLVEIFQKRGFTCDCGTTRFAATSPCNLRINPATNTKGSVHSEAPESRNKYNQNFRNRFCGCECDYDPMQQKGTMFQCLGLGTVEGGACGEDWYHPGCLVGMGSKWFEKMPREAPSSKAADGTLAPVAEEADAPEGAAPVAEEVDAPEGAAPDENMDGAEEEDVPAPPGFPAEDDFDGFICYKCIEAFPWIKRYADSPGFLKPVFLQDDATQLSAAGSIGDAPEPVSKKRRADDDASSVESKRHKSDADTTSTAPAATSSGEGQETTASTCKFDQLPPAPEGRFSLFFTAGFRDNICHCPKCFPLLKPHPQLLEEEDVYEPPVSEGSEEGGSSLGSGSLLERGESALRNVDRVRAIEGVMAYNHLKDKLKPFFQQFAESGKAISAEDIKEYFAKLRGDEQAIKDAGEAVERTNFREEQDGY